MRGTVEFTVFWFAVILVPAALAFARPRRVWWVVALGGVIALRWWSLSWFGSIEGDDGTYSRAEDVAFGVVVSGVTLGIWTCAVWAGRVARHLVIRRRSRRAAPS